MRWEKKLLLSHVLSLSLAGRYLTQQHHLPFCPPGAPGECEVCHWGHGGDRLQRPGCHDHGPEGHLLRQCWLHHHLRLWLAQQTACPHLWHQRQLLFLCWGCANAHTYTQITKNWKMAESVLRWDCLQVEGPKQDLHSGVYGGAVIEPMTDLIGILGECIPEGTCAITHSVLHRKVRHRLEISWALGWCQVIFSFTFYSTYIHDLHYLCLWDRDLTGMSESRFSLRFFFFQFFLTTCLKSELIAICSVFDINLWTVLFFFFKENGV